MAIIWADFPSGSKGIYGDTIALMNNGVWAAVGGDQYVAGPSLVADVDPTISTEGIVLGMGPSGVVAAGSSFARFALPSPAATEGIAFRLWLSEMPRNAGISPYISFNDTSNNTIFAIRFLTTGAIEARNAITNSGTQFGVTSGPAITANAYHHIEIKGKADTATGTIEVRVDGTTVLNLSALAMSTTSIAQIVLGSYMPHTVIPSPNSYWKDIVFWDTSGSEANDFIGSQGVFWLPLDGDVTLGGWVPSSGTTGYNLINVSPPVDTDYISADSTPPAAAEFTFQDLPEDISSVTALVPVVRSQKSDGGDGYVQTSLISETDADAGANRQITTAFTYWWDVSHQDPHTSSPWTVAAVNAATLKIDRTL